VIRHLESYEDDKYAYIIMEAMENALELQQVLAEKYAARGNPRSLEGKPLFTEEEI
jgi:hypothetical protein